MKETGNRAFSSNSPLFIQDKLALQSAEGISLVDPMDVLYLRADGSYTHVVMKGNQKMLLAKSLVEFMKLEEKGYFLRIHRSFIINLNHINKVLKQDRGTLVMSEGMEVSISPDKKQDLQEFLTRFKI